MTISNTDSKPYKAFLVMWETTGLKCLMDASTYLDDVEVYDKEKVWAVLSDIEFNKQHPGFTTGLKTMILNAIVHKINIYHFVSYDYTKSELESLFQKDFQHAVDLVAKNGEIVF